ncbi:MAG TPA: cupin domain-containing protein [Acidimicrobiales bacterium]|jgi:quercetin dioxygenase-like cupin family protein|nr:cupin domain-containing protein [Acidimicrobiales bacterium]
MRHEVLRSGDRPWKEHADGPDGAAGYRRQVLIDEACGSVHLTLGWAALDPGAEVRTHVHSFEKTIYVVEGSLDLALGGAVHRLGVDDYALVPLGSLHALRSVAGARWLEVIAPQARLEPRDTFALGEPPDWSRAAVPDFASPVRGLVGHFSEDQLPPPSKLQMEGYSGGDVTGIRLKMLVDRVFGAQHMNVFMVEFQPGGAGNSHDHPLEEAYVILSGRADALLDGQRYEVGVGDVVWTGVGGVHAFFPAGGAPVRWIEVQAPQPPAQHAFRFLQQWRHVEEHLER